MKNKVHLSKNDWKAIDAELGLGKKELTVPETRNIFEVLDGLGMHTEANMDVPGTRVILTRGDTGALTRITIEVTPVYNYRLRIEDIGDKLDIKYRGLFSRPTSLYNAITEYFRAR